MRKFILAGAILVFAACSDGGGTTGPGAVTTVAVTSAPTQISVNETAQASAVVKDQNGNALSGKTVTWESLNPSVATVSATGSIKGVAAGSATIRGTVDGVSGTAEILVIASVSVCNTGLTVVDLPVGGVSVLSSSATKGCIKIPAATSAPADYLVIAANTNAVPDVVGDYVFKSDEGETVPSTNLFPSNSVVSAANAAVQGTGPDLGAMQAKFETRLRLMERRQLRIPDAQRAYRNRIAERQARLSLSVAIPAIGDQTTFKVPAQTDACNKFTTITAAVTYINDKAIIYNDVASPANGFTATDYQQIGDEFSTLIYPTDVSYFGTPLDLDNNGRIIILYTPEVNKLTPANNSSFVGGFFFAGDLFPSTAAKAGDFACAQSNVAELFYVLAPDPDGTINNNRRTTTTVRQGTRGTIAHEFQHMINASERIRSPIEQPLEVVWLDEALAHFAEDAVGRVVRGIGETDNAGFARTVGGNLDDFNAFFFQNFARFQRYLQNPGPFGPTSSAADTSLAVRGAAWALLHYAADQYAPGGDIKAYIKKLAGGPDTGVVNMTKNAGGVSFETLITGWMIANYADDGGIPGLSAVNSYKVYDMRNIQQGIPGSAGLYPLKVTNISGSGFVVTGLQARSGSGNYFFALRNTGSLARTYRFLNPDGATAASFTGASWIVVRTR
jgi:Bacterial Ig-like domain (group 2)